MTDNTNIDDFARRAIDYCRFVDSAHDLDMHERVKGAVRVLSDLVRCAVDLPSGDAASPVIDEDISAPDTWPGFGQFGFYWMTFDPSVEEAPVGGSLDDDLLDIYRDLRRGLIAFEEGDAGSAAWEWRFHFESHWGRHATAALRALTELLTSKSYEQRDGR